MWIRYERVDTFFICDREGEGWWERGRGLVEGGREGRASGKGWWVGGFLGGVREGVSFLGWLSQPGLIQNGYALEQRSRWVEGERKRVGGREVERGLVEGARKGKASERDWWVGLFLRMCCAYESSF